MMWVIREVENVESANKLVKLSDEFVTSLEMGNVSIVGRV